MDVFEKLVGKTLSRRGYWTMQGYTLENLSAADKKALYNPTMPRVEFDLIAYKPGTNELLALEVKSYLDSFGVHQRDLLVEHPTCKGVRFKEFTVKAYRDLVIRRLHEQLIEQGFVAIDSEMPRLGLAVGKWASGSEAPIRNRFEEMGWELIGPEDICHSLEAMANEGYSNDEAVMVAKMLLRDETKMKAPRES